MTISRCDEIRPLSDISHVLLVTLSRTPDRTLYRGCNQTQVRRPNEQKHIMCRLFQDRGIHRRIFFSFIICLPLTIQRIKIPCAILSSSIIVRFDDMGLHVDRHNIKGCIIYSIRRFWIPWFCTPRYTVCVRRQ